MSWYGWGGGLGHLRRLVNFGRKGRKAPKKCPKCGRWMVTHTVYYECPGCGHVEHTPTPKRKRLPQLVDKLDIDERVHESLEEGEDSSFALATVPPEMAGEYRSLWYFGAMVLLIVVGGWGGSFWLGTLKLDYHAVQTCWNIASLGFLFLAVALLSSSSLLKQLGIWVAVAMVALLAFTESVLPAGAREDLLPRVYAHTYHRYLVDMQLYGFYIAAAYCAWLALYLFRERRLRGF